MKFTPRYTITPKLLQNIKEIDRLVVQLNNRKFSKTVLHDIEKEARILSTYSSTSIEGNPIPLTDVKRLIKTKPSNIRDTQREILNYNSALEKLNIKVKQKKLKFDLDIILDIHRMVVDKLLSDGMSGALRDGQVGVNNPRTGEMIYIAPDAKEVADMLASLIDFVDDSEGEIDPLIVAGIFHKQFILIHPFVDGNGRTVRLATKVLLAKLGLNTFNLFSFENYYNNNVSRYFDMVGERGIYYDISENLDFTQWLEYFTEGIIDEIERIKKVLEKTSVDPEERVLPHLTKIIKYIEDYGSITDLEYSKITERAKATRVIDFNELIRRGIIVRKGKARRTYYVLK